MAGRQYVHGSRGLWNKRVNPKRKPSVTSAMDLDCHITQKPKRNAARANPSGKAKASKAERKAENAARKRWREASHKVIVEHRIGQGRSKKSAPTNIDRPKLPSNEELERWTRRVLAIQTDIEATERRLATLKGQLVVAMDKLKIPQNPANSIKQIARRSSPKPKGWAK